MARVSITIRASDEQKARWASAAHREELSLSGWLRRTLDARAAELTGRRGNDGEGETVVRPGPSAEPEPPAVEPPAPEVDFQGPDRDDPESGEAWGPPAPERGFRPDPKVKPAPKARKALSDVMSGTVSGAQSVKAIEAARMKQQREDAFSLTCPSRAEHQTGTRCPHCHGIQ